VRSLEGQPAVGTNITLYSGYLNITNTTKQLHYVGALSKNDPKTDPVMIWFNGGPGCSSLLGYALEHGPYIIDELGDPSKANEFVPNKYSWNNNATVIYLESPAGVGFSYCGNATEC
jgi:carboxypeptidase C (cathepsin A)